MNYKHGHATGGGITRTYRIWEGVRHRCKHHPEYAGRGITCDPRWARFENFLADMGEAPPGLTLDRIDNDGGYSKANCRWATYSQQNANQRRRRDRTTPHGNSQFSEEQVVVILNDYRPHRRIAEDYGVSHSVIGRIKRGRAYKHVSRR